MAEFYEVVAEIGKRRMEDRLDKVKKGYHFFWEDEEVIRENDGFLHRCSSFSWKSKYREPTPFVAVRSCVAEFAVKLLGTHTGCAAQSVGGLEL